MLAVLEPAKRSRPTSVNGDMRFWAGYALMGLGHAEGTKILLEVLQDDHATLRRYASEAFVEFPDKAAVPLLIRATADKNEEVRGNAIVASARSVTRRLFPRSARCWPMAARRK